MKDFEQRKLELLNRIVQQYIRSAHPVGSLFLSEQLPMSPASIRNAMALLEEEGYMYQPHTSAGRIPTPAAYRIYIQCMRPVSPRKNQLQQLEEAWREERVEFQHKVKKLAKMVADASGEIVFAAFDPGTVVLTGMKNLYLKPEFQDRQTVAELSDLIDSLDDSLQSFYERAGDGPTVLVGGDTIIPASCSVIVSKYSCGQHHGIIGIVGPLRMHYDRNISLLNSMKDVIES